MPKSLPDYKTAFFFALGFILLNVLLLTMYLFGRDFFLLSEDQALQSGRFGVHIVLIHLGFIFLNTYLLYLLNFKLLRTDFSSLKKLVFIILFTFSLATVLSYACSWIQIHIQEPSHSYKIIRGGLVRDYGIAIIVIFSSQILYLSRKQQQIVLENTILQAENIKTRFIALKNQVDPHFLFNALNTLNSLIKTDPDKAQEYVQQLSSVFRYILQNKQVITLEEELKFCDAYCHLMQIRYGDCLQIEQNIDKSYLNYYIIPLSLQILVENAIKHNVISLKQPLKITISTHENETIRVGNSIQMKKKAEVGEGIGLANLSEHYLLMWKEKITISNKDGLFVVEVPLKQYIN